ncbi:amidohydrolase [Celeribacter indicus]|uniref:Hydrolase n=1 Tax=Celeribacter indicus TaxID=1208324 RepID=A0A0B5DXL5_9RHOB|nr:amidohydrolase [Celeribacter indicus]AJE48173.1 hydrolase [Celeribacter indicus]SDW34389.1 hippurate hydrolase [Celeribacter indicus]
MPHIRADDIAADHDFVGRITAIRRDLHAHPETAYEELRTSDIVAAFLEDLGLEVHRGLGGTGVVATLEGRRPGQRAIGLRADMDALHIAEETGLPHASTVPGKMHACGHDGHTAMLLGAAERLSRAPDFAGQVRFVFQPAEEAGGGAAAMIRDGLLERFPMDAIYGLHTGPMDPLGLLTTRVGPYTAASDDWEVVFRGTGGHGAAPHKGTDPTVAAGQFMAQLGNIVARKVALTDWAVVSVGHVAGGERDSPNIIPATVLVAGTARSYLPEVRDRLEREISRLAGGVALAADVVAEVDYRRGYPALINTAAEVGVAGRAHAAGTGAELTRTAAPAIGASEDFAYYLERLPGAYVSIGNGDGPGAAFVHTPKFDFNDALIPIGVAYWMNVVAEELGGAEVPYTVVSR